MRLPELRFRARRSSRRRELAAAAISAVVALALGAATASRAAVAVLQAKKFVRLSALNLSTQQAAAIARTPDGTLHLVYQMYSGSTVTGLASQTISPAGIPGPQVTALAGWHPGQPGLVVLPNGSLEAVFGGSSPKNVAAVFGINSSDGGATWSAPAIVGGQSSSEALAYGSDITAAMAGTTPVMTLPQAGNLVVQQGLLPPFAGYQVNTTADGAVGDANVATDAASKQVVAGWPSIATSLTDYLASVTPTPGNAEKIPGQFHNAVEVAGRDVGPGVFTPYSSDGTHVRLLRYAGGTVAVGKAAGVTAQRLGVATAIQGRMWVMWGDDSGTGHIAVTRSNKAVTRFEPIQVLNPNADGVARISGDGRLGPLDLLVDELPHAKSPQPPGNYYLRVLPELNATASRTMVKNKAGTVTGFKLLVHVTDAGDAVQGATVSAHGTKAKTNGSGAATLALPASAAGKNSVSVTAPGYAALTLSVNL